MKPPADLPLEIVLLVNRFANRLGIPQPDFWSMLYGKQPKPAGWAAAWSEEFDPLLPSVPNDAKVRYMSQALVQPDPRGRKVGRPIVSTHLFAQWLRGRNVTITEWAASHEDPDTGKPFKRERVKSWIADGTGGRPVPGVTADAIEKESRDPKTKRSAVPARDATWPNGIRRP